MAESEPKVARETLTIEIADRYYIIWSIQSENLESFYVYDGPMETFDDIHRAAFVLQAKMGLPALPLIKSWKCIQ